MRFHANGPNIPDLLLERRDQGRVVFFCGAGVSLKAGMPTFFELTQHVVDFFDPLEGSEIATAFNPHRDLKNSTPKTPLDQVFHLLYQEYGRDEVNALVSERLHTEIATSTEFPEHKLIAKISSDQEGKPQIVTTNFDRLFEQAVEIDIRNIYEPPTLPDISLGVPITGLTYLHGRLQEPSEKHHPYILGSADFGRAYLSEAWATRFVRSLLDHYTVVLVGYKAEDPPVRYLLQGLNHDGMSDRTNLYAFDRGAPEEIEANWRDRGVTAIAYDDHDDLWKTLSAWADRSANPRVWRSKVIDLARKGPKKLAAHERGQVAHLVRTTPGARLFATADPSPTAEWLCVFDASCRVAKKSRGYAETFDPLEVYGLDEDPPRSSETETRTCRIHDHFLEWRRGDTNPPTFHRIGSREVNGFEDIPPRLFHLTRWIANHLAEPVTAWWALRQHGLHPRLIDSIQRMMKQATELPPVARQTWNLILEYQSDFRRLLWDGGWFELQDRIKKDGWTLGVLREWEAVTSPKLSANLPLGIGASKPPFETWEETGLDELVRWEVKFPDRHGEKVEIPDDVLSDVFRISEGHLHLALNLLKDLNTIHITTPSCYPGRETDGEDEYFEDETFFRWFMDLFNRMVEYNPTVLRSRVIAWPTDDEFYFRKLRLYALNRFELFAADEAAEALLGLDENDFWDTEVRRELLFLVHDRWDHFSDRNRRAIVERLLGGPARREDWSEEEYPKIRDEFAARYTKWLSLQGRLLDEDQAKRLDAIIEGLPEWDDGKASSTVTKHGVIIEWIETDEMPDTILDLSDAEVVERAKADHRHDFRSFTEKRPFTGLVKANPRKALSALSIAARNHDFPEVFWTALIREWPGETAPRLNKVFLLRLGRLPYKVIRELRHTVGWWIEQKFKEALTFDPDIAWSTFDHLVSGLVSDSGHATKSSLGEAWFGGETAESSRRTYGHAIKGPIGAATKGLLYALNTLQLKEGQGIPEEYKARLDHLLAAPGEGCDHAVSILAQKVSWLHHLDPDWVTDRIIPWLSFEHPVAEPAWNGFLSSGEIPSASIRTLSKDYIIDLFPYIYSFNWDRDLAKVAANWIVWMAIFKPSEPDGVTIQDARQCLRLMDDKTRNDVIFLLGRIGSNNENGWTEYVIPFVTKVWPRERKYRTENSVLSWVSLLDKADDMFPAMLDAIRIFLIPVEGKNHWLYRFRGTARDKEPLTIKHPEAVLELLDAVVPNNPESAPVELAQILSTFEEYAPELTQDRRYFRLINLVESR